MFVKLLCLICSLLILSCSTFVNKVEKNSSNNLNILSESEIEDGWELLFDGKTFNGWKGIGIDSIPSGHWKIENGCIRKIKSGDVPLRADGQPLKGGDLISRNKFENFELIFEWKISENGNSGIKYNVDENYSIINGSSNALGFEYQVLDDEKNTDNAIPSHRSGSLYDLIEAKDKTLKPVGEFNSAKIIFTGNHGEHWLNGKKVVEYELDSKEFFELFMKSKYSKHDDFIKHKIAHIVLQDHGSDCWYRNIKIKILK
ncbi:MAG: DUF1080 domain-containing protein [Ignavibacteriae bacterium]|nr:DUF1080 domain-containing protein [Ignavibacteriota bacterium]